MTSYWYSTNGMSQRRLSLRHLSTLDQAFERHARIQLFDDDVFGQNVPAIANPYQGTMTAGDLHFGLYRQPPIWHMSDTSLDTLILMDSDSQIDEALNSLNLSSNTTTTKLGNSRHTDGDDKDEVNNRNNILPRMGNASLDNNHNSNNSQRSTIVGGRNMNGNQSRYKYTRRKRLVLSQTTEEHCVCCIIS